ncbi:MAG: hypothetical protein GY847_17685 [Proteobacteria bacterium]|nr:hypothetical protein [Pseudomonadota bacterium]
MQLGPSIPARSWILAAVLLGCSASKTNDSDYNGPVNSCSDSSDCPDYLICNSEHKLCVADVAYGQKYYIKVIPRPQTSIPKQVFYVTLDTDGTASIPGDDGVMQKLLPVKTPKPAFLKIVFKEDNKRKEIDSKVLVFNTGTVIPNHPAQITVYDIETETKSGDFAITIAPGIRQYQLKIVPQGQYADIIPVLYLDDVTVTQSGGLRDSTDAGLDEIVMPVAKKFITGTVFRGEQPVNGLTVRAIDPKSERIVSTQTLTGCPDAQDPPAICGEFQIGLAPDVTSYLLRISHPTETWYPTFTTIAYTVDQETADGGIEEPAPIEIKMAPLGTPIRYYARVEDTSSDGVPNCLVYFKGTDVAGGVATRTAFTDSTGALEDENGISGINLYSAHYRMTVHPPRLPEEATELAVFQWPSLIDISGSSTIAGPAFPLEPRPRITGRVMAENNPVPFGITTAYPMIDDPLLTRTSSTAINPDGLFTIATDFGRYRLVTEAPVQSGFAWNATVIDCAEDQFLPIHLPHPFVARAALSLDEGGIEGAVVEWHKITTDSSYLVWRSTADAKGKVVALLPP